MEPLLITVIKRLAELEAAVSLSPGGIDELNALRRQLHDGWPEVSVAIADAYVTAGGSRFDTPPPHHHRDERQAAADGITQHEENPI